MRWIVTAVLAAACTGAPRAPSAKSERAARAAELADISPQATAGLYWIPYVTCDSCAAPAALVAYVTPDEAQARRIKAALEGSLPLGLPWVLHTDQLDDRGSRVVVANPGIAIVIGSYATLEDAKRAAEHASPYDRVHARVIDLAGADRAESRGENGHLVTVVDRGAPAPAWSARDIEAILNVVDSGEYEGTREEALARELAKYPPTCTVQPGALFEALDNELRWYTFAPVRCGRERAYITWTASLLGHAVIVRDRSGDHLRQIVGAECDSPDIREWRYDEHGRHSDPAPRLASEGC